MRPVVPAYFHPAVAGEHWQALFAPDSTVRAVVLNVDSGPGIRPELELMAVAHRVTAPLLGYVDLHYGRRPWADVVTDLTRYRDWYPTTGIFFDRVNGTVAELFDVGGAVAAARRLGATTVILNHGVYPDPAYATIADALVTFEGPADAYEQVSVPKWVRHWPAEKFVHLVYDTPPHRIDEVRRHAERCHAGSVYVTDRGGANPWDGLPGYLLGRRAAA
jgi:hypothetical protein